MKYRRLKIRWTPGFTAGGTNGWLGSRTILPSISIANHGRFGWWWMVPEGGPARLVGSAHTEMAARIAAVRALRKHLKMLAC